MAELGERDPREVIEHRFGQSLDGELGNAWFLRAAVRASLREEGVEEDRIRELLPDIRELTYEQVLKTSAEALLEV